MFNYREQKVKQYEEYKDIFICSSIKEWKERKIELLNKIQLSKKKIKLKFGTNNSKKLNRLLDCNKVDDFIRELKHFKHLSVTENVILWEHFQLQYKLMINNIKLELELNNLEQIEEVIRQYKSKGTSEDFDYCFSNMRVNAGQISILTEIL